MIWARLFKRAEGALAPPELEPDEHVLWQYPPGAPNKRLTFLVRSDNEFRLTVQTRLDAMGKFEPWLSKDQVRDIVARISLLAKL